MKRNFICALSILVGVTMGCDGQGSGGNPGSANALGGANNSAKAVDYTNCTITDLSAALTQTGSPIGGALSGNSINNNGDVVGQATFPNTGNYHAAYWHNGTVHDLGVFGDPLSSHQTSAAMFISDAGLIVGTAYSATTSTDNTYNLAAVFSVGGSPVNIHSPMTYGANNSAVRAAGNGYLVGQAYDDTATYMHAVVWGNGTGTPSSWSTVADKNPQGPGSTSPSAIMGINDAGQMVGWNILNPQGHSAPASATDRYQRATLWDANGSVKYLDLSGDSRYTSINFSQATGAALRINNAGQVLVSFTGFGDNVVNGLAGIWQKDGSFTEIPHLAGYEDLFVASINNLGKVVATARHQAPGGATTHVVLYDNGGLTDLSSLLAGTGWYLTGAADINANGQILVQANRTGFTRSATTTLVLTPGPAR